MIVDIHTHIYPRRYLDRLKQRTDIPRVDEVAGGERLVIFADEERAAGGPRPLGPEYSLSEHKLAYMDRHGIALSGLSLGNPWVDFMDPAEAAWWAASLNGELESLCSETRRFRAFGVLPLQDVVPACAELGRLAALPHLHGAIVGTRPGGLHLDDAALAPF